jgi:hypothetical protein
MFTVAAFHFIACQHEEAETTISAKKNARPEPA